MKKNWPVVIMEPNREVVVVEMECLRGGLDDKRGGYGKLVVKELAMAHRDCVDLFLFMSPQPWEPPEMVRHNRWIRQNINGLRWHHGYVPYEMLPVIVGRIAGQFNTLYTKGSEKASMLREIISSNAESSWSPNWCHVIDLDSIGCPKLGQMKEEISAKCMLHYGLDGRKQCAMEKALKFYLWLRNKKKEGGEGDEAQEKKQEREQHQNMELEMWDD